MDHSVVHHESVVALCQQPPQQLLQSSRCMLVWEVCHCVPLILVMNLDPKKEVKDPEICHQYNWWLSQEMLTAPWPDPV